VVVFRDIGERVSARERLRDHASELQARNEDLHAFSHTVAHDLKGPLNLLIGFAEALQSDQTDLSSEQMDEYLGMIAQTGHKMANIVDELLLLAEIRQKEAILRPLSMADIVAEAQEGLSQMIEESEVEILVPDSWPTALGHGPWIEQVWANYISNGIKYGGRPPRLQLGAAPDSADSIRFWVRDNGPGLTPEEQAQLFKPFTRLSRARATGHGLGLSIVRHIVEKLGGQVGIESVVGQGSLFFFTLAPAGE
jgi:signal transduction histidine kinase